MTPGIDAINAMVDKIILVKHVPADVTDTNRKGVDKQ